LSKINTNEFFKKEVIVLNLLLLTMIFIILIYSGKIIKEMKNTAEWQFKSDYLKYGYLSRYYLSMNLSPSKFEDFCKDILGKMGYKNLEYVSETMESGNNIRLTSSKLSTYISTRLYGVKNNEKRNIDDSYEAIGRSEVQKFIGALVHDKIKNGIIMTTGDFTEEAIKYTESLPGEYTIKLIDGIALTKELRKIREKEIIDIMICNAAN